MVDVGIKPEWEPAYLGDGLYVSFDGWQFRLYADTAFGGLNEVFLEPDVLAAFQRYVAKLKGTAPNATG